MKVWFSLRQFDWKKGTDVLFCDDLDSIKHKNGTMFPKIIIRSHKTKKEFTFFMETFDDQNGCIVYSNKDDNCPIRLVCFGTTIQIARSKADMDRAWLDYKGYKIN